MCAKASAPSAIDPTPIALLRVRIVMAASAIWMSAGLGTWANTFVVEAGRHAARFARS
jgi:hypothetical protein